MSVHPLSFDHVHLVSNAPDAAAAWYVDKLAGRIERRYEMRGAPQIFVAVGNATLIIRGQRTGERADAKQGLEWGVDHFGFGVEGDFDGYCAGLEAAGVEFSLGPTDVNPTTRIAFIRAPDGVSIELLQRRPA
jgi:catechol 2,3-dioxygenase-like lactoylglutathione lyase family enzyme